MVMYENFQSLLNLLKSFNLHTLNKLVIRLELDDMEIWISDETDIVRTFKTNSWTNFQKCETTSNHPQMNHTFVYCLNVSKAFVVQKIYLKC
jgi:hypothetical protein